ncbi:carbamoyltransferase family protein [Algibacillus agarilyticus]|uniref:carbamoyltransferase family protein n=1 Tax=Algibacillus agarilyticus TaxID=2234133 RepID=UPI000DCFBFCB|nr:carbamoyltransferase [Algibacillus agarilyticus]
MAKRILGISAYYHDSAAAVVDDGVIVAAAQEERFSRKKHDPDFPAQAIQYCLDTANCKLTDLDAIIFYDKPLLKFERLLETYLANAPRGVKSFINAMPVWLKEKLYLKTVLRRALRELAGLDKKAKMPTLLFSEHHLSHAASAFFPSPYQDAAVLCLDGVGEWATSTAWQGQKNKLTPIWEINFPHSLGLLYSAFTYYTGFKVNSGEYKLMGLAPYGEPKYVDLILDHLIEVQADGSFALDMSYFNFATGLTMTSAKFHALFGGEPRDDKTEVSQKEMDLARSIQVVTEEIVLKIVNHLATLTPSKNLCLAGGVALNCVANGRILRESAFDHIWIQPAAGDAGGALGAALLVWHHYFEGERSQNATESSDDLMQGAYLGCEYTDEDIITFLEAEKALGRALPYHRYSSEHTNELLVDTASWIEAGNVIGWFQGRMEFGPRALGNRSIIGDARNQAMQATMNLKIKYRESFRPFAPIVLAEDINQYFKQDVSSPYMLLVADIKDDLRIATNDDLFGIDKLNQARSTLPAITHVDYSARLQTVHKQTNPKLHQLLSAFKQKTGTSVLINTSFNVRGEPPVCSPEDAIRCFLATEMDYLVMGNIMLRKTEQPQSAIDAAKAIEFEMD